MFTAGVADSNNTKKARQMISDFYVNIYQKCIWNKIGFEKSLSGICWNPERRILI